MFRPGDDPLGGLAQALGQPPDVIGKSSLGLVEAARSLDAGDKLLVIVDQFEELFRVRQTGSEDSAAAFVKLLLRAAFEDGAAVFVVLTMRTDYLGACTVFRGLPEVLNGGQYLIPRMTRDQFTESIEGPIAVGGAAITPQLVQRLLNDVGDDPDQLPILQHALMRTGRRGPRPAPRAGRSTSRFTRPPAAWRRPRTYTPKRPTASSASGPPASGSPASSSSA